MHASVARVNANLKYIKDRKQKREGLMGCVVRGAPIEFVVEIVGERKFRKSREFQVELPGKKKPVWVPRGDVVEIQRIAQQKPLTRAERREYERLFDQWTKYQGLGAEDLDPSEITRFADLSERVALEGAG